MKILEFGDKSKHKLILIHGFQSPWQVWEPYIAHYKKDFHVIVPIVSGHDPQTKEDFVSFAKDARELEDYIISHYGEKVHGIFGMSMGGVLTATLWQNGRLQFENVLFDGSPLVSMNRFMKSYTRNFYLNVTHKVQCRDQKTLQQARSICPEAHMDHFIKILDNMSDTTIENCLNCIADFKLRGDIDTPDTKIYFFHGTAMNEMLAKKSAKYVKQHYPATDVKCFKGKAHCENSIFHPEYMITELDAIFFN